MIFFADAEFRQENTIDYFKSFPLFFLPQKGGNKPNPFNVIPNEGLEGYAFSMKMLCRLAADTNKEYIEYWENKDYAEVFEMYVMKGASSI